MTFKSKASIPVFHGGLTGNIKKFYPCTHFGIRKQAVHCAIRQAILEKKTKEGEQYLYSCRINADESEIHHMEDWDSPKPFATLKRYLEDLNRHDVWREIQRTYVHGSHKDPNDPIYLGLLGDYMSEKKHRVLSYDNIHEGEGKSYMVFCDDDVVIDGIQEISLEELKEVFYESLRNRSMTLPPIWTGRNFDDVFSLR